MKVSTLTITPQEAVEKLAAYRQLSDKQRTLVDDDLLRLYRMVQGGKRILNVNKAFQQTGLNELGQPKLAMARADWEQVWFHPHQEPDRGFAPGGGTFESAGRLHPLLKKNCYHVPMDTFNRPRLTNQFLRSAVPHIPPAIRPRTYLNNYWILFEVESWTEYPVDPFLLRHVHGSLYVVEAEWELTPLEAELLTALSS